MRGLLWFKKDLRIGDQMALFHACQQSNEGVIGVYVIDTAMWKNHHTAHCQIELILRGLIPLREDLKKIGIPLQILQVTGTEQIPDLLLEFSQEHHINAMFYNREYEINEQKRDIAVCTLLAKHNIDIHGYDDQFILSPSLLKRDTGEYFKVFTPFKNHWISRFYQTAPFTLLKTPKSLHPIEISCNAIPENLTGIASGIDLTLWPAGEKQARKRLTQFIQQSASRYNTARDFPALDQTSRLSPYLATGMISPRECFHAALIQNNQEPDSGNQGLLTWMSELIWREFYRLILIAAPHVCMNKAYKRQTDKLHWSYDKKLLLAWQQGKTGFPLVDSAMRQLNATGWMHNRLRMVTAMFLSKNLFLDWRLGEHYFAEHLIDIDFASNNGGWQWSASTGTDAVPYFRIFNPTTQSQRFDPDGDFIRHYCPELASFNNKQIHDPHGTNHELAVKCGYPEPIIDYKASRQRVLDAFKELG